MAEHITIESLQAENADLKQRNVELTRALIEQATATHEQLGHFGSFTHCHTEACVILRKKIEENNGNE